MPPYPFVYLASQSPRRQELPRQIGVRYEPLLPRPDEDAEAYVIRVCALKAHAARARLLKAGLMAAPILTADTTVTIDGLIFGKPQHEDDAVSMLEYLVGREHELLTAIAVVDAEGTLLEPVLSRSTVRFAAANRAALQR